MHSPTINQRHGSACSSELAHACRELHGHDEVLALHSSPQKFSKTLHSGLRAEGTREEEDGTLYWCGSRGGAEGSGSGRKTAGVLDLEHCNAT